MTLRKLNRPFTFNNDFDVLFNDFFAGPANVIKEGKKKFFGEVPAVNVTENDNNYQIALAAPGKKKSDFNIEVNDGIMLISSESSTENNEVKEKFTRREFNYSSFERRFTLPENIDSDNIGAKYENGILMIELPKLKAEAEKESPKKIEIA